MARKPYAIPASRGLSVAIPRSIVNTCAQSSGARFGRSRGWSGHRQDIFMNTNTPAVEAVRNVTVGQVNDMVRSIVIGWGIGAAIAIIIMTGLCAFFYFDIKRIERDRRK